MAFCPDQLGPAVSRELTVASTRWPSHGLTPRRSSTGSTTPPRSSRLSPALFVKLLESRAGATHTIFYVWAPGYVSYGNDCQEIADGLAANRRQQGLVAEEASDTPFEIFEGENLYRYPPS